MGSRNYHKLTRSDDDVVDRDENELHEKPYKSHDHETNGCTNCYLRKLYTEISETVITIYSRLKTKHIPPAGSEICDLEDEKLQELQFYHIRDLVPFSSGL